MEVKRALSRSRPSWLRFLQIGLGVYRKEDGTC